MFERLKISFRNITLYFLVYLLNVFFMASLNGDILDDPDGCDDGDDTESEFVGEPCPYLDYQKIWPLYLMKQAKTDNSAFENYREIDLSDLIKMQRE